MKTIQHNNHLLVEVPEGKTAEMTTAGLMVFTDNKSVSTARRVPLPDGATYLGLASEMSEEQCEEIVRPLTSFDEDGNYEDFVQSELRGFTQGGLDTAFASFASLLAKHGLKGKTTVVIRIDS